MQLIATLNSYAHTVSPMARLKWSAFLRGVFGALQNHDRHIGTCGALQLGVIGLEFYPCTCLAQNDIPSAWMYGQDNLWATSHLVSSLGEVFPPPTRPPLVTLG